MRWFAKLALVFWGVVLMTAPARADEWEVPQPSWEGVWQGTVGAVPVHVCLDKTPYEQKGAYYYDRVKILLRMVPGKVAGEWYEQETFDKNGARWQLSGQQNELVGRWTSGAKTLPIRLKRIGASSKDHDGPCGAAAFNAPRWTQTRLTTRHATKDGFGYTIYSFQPGPWLKDDVDITAFTLDPSIPGATKINAKLRADLPRTDGTGVWSDCIASATNSLGMDGDYHRSVEPVLISARWMSVRAGGEDFCGGAHPNSGEVLRTFDIVRGIEVDPLDWFGVAAVHVETFSDGSGSFKTLTPAFVAFALKGWKADDAECDEAMRQQDVWGIGIERGMFVLSPGFPHVMTACSEDFKISFARVQPWLSAAGKATVATLPR